MFEMHRLVKLVMKYWLKLKDTCAGWERKALIRLEEEFPDPKFAVWPVCEAFCPHARLVAEYHFEESSID